MKKINLKIPLFILILFIILIIFSPKQTYQYVPYKNFYSEAINHNVSTIYLSSSEKILFQKTNSEKMYQTDNPNYEGFKKEMLLNGISFKNSPPLKNMLLPILCLALLPFAVFFIYKRSKKTANLTLSLENQPQQNKPNIFFKDIAGNEEAKENAKDIVDFLNNPEKYKNLGAKVPKGLIFYGPSGTGKTLMAKAIATEANATFFYACGSDFIEMYAGVGSARIRNLFKNARKCEKAIIFIDEIDAIGKKRASSLESSNEEREHTLNALLTEMSGFKTDDNIVIIGATNRLDILDEALLRAGRFDRHIEINLPDVSSREKILNLLLKDKNTENINIKNLAKKTVYFSGAMLDSLVNEATIIAVKSNSSHILDEHIEKAYLKIIAGDEKKDISYINEQDKKITAIHEVGHAITSYALNVSTLSKISILPTTKGAGGFCLNIYEDKLFENKKDIENKIISLYGGRACEEIFLGKDNITIGASNDIEKATRLILDYVKRYALAEDVLLNYDILNTDNNIPSICKNLSKHFYKQAKDIILQNQNKVENLTKALLQKETLEEEQIYQILNN